MADEQSINPYSNVNLNQPGSQAAIDIVREYVKDGLDKSDPPVDFDTYIVWSCKTLQNFKCLLSTSLPDGMYYEVTYNGDMDEYYLDAYKKFQNVRIPRYQPDRDREPDQSPAIV